LLAVSRGMAVRAGGLVVAQMHGVDSEIGQLRTVVMHRPGAELQRTTPRHAEGLLLRTLPWISKAREEHDVLCQVLRDQGAEVLYFTELLQDALEYAPARTEAVGLAVADAELGDELRGQLRAYLDDLGPEQLAQVLIAGLTPEELKIGHGVVFELLDRHDFVLEPLPNLIFTKDSSFWIGDHLAVASLAAQHRHRETDLASVVYRHHPRFAGAKWIYRADLEQLDGGDVLLLAPGVVAIGVSQRTTPAGAERLARRLFDAQLARTVLAVPIRQHNFAFPVHLDTLCAVVDADAVLMHPGIAYTLTAHTISPQADGLRVSRPQPFLEAAAQAMRIGRLRVIDSGLDPVIGQSGQGGDGSNVLAISRRLVVSHERNSDANDRLEAAGISVIRVPSSELTSLRGGPRCMTCPVARDYAAQPGGRPDAAAPTLLVGHADPKRTELVQASLEATVRPAGYAPAAPEETEQHPDHGNDHRDHDQPEHHVDDGQDDKDENYGADNRQQHAKHASTVRRRYRHPLARRPATGPRPRRPDSARSLRSLYFGHMPSLLRAKSCSTG
jgi:arginine deiminase